MSVRHKILALLAIAPCYGFQLRSEIERRGEPQIRVNVGQIYSTLERLERDGLAFRGDTDEHGHVFYTISERGRELVAEWLGRPVAPVEALGHLAFALSLPGVDAMRLIATQRVAIEALGAVTGGQSEKTSMLEVAVGEGLRAVAVAQLAWLDRCVALLSENERVFSYGLADAPPRRGRPASAASG